MFKLLISILLVTFTLLSKAENLNISVVDLKDIQQHAIEKFEGMNASQWFGKMQQALKTQSYQGEFLYRKNSIMQTFSIDHHKVNGVWQETVKQLDGKKYEISTDDTGRGTLVHDGEKINFLHVNHNVLNKKFESWSKYISKHYKLTLLKKTNFQVAGRSVFELVILPKDRFRYGYIYWLDVKYGLPLRSITFSRAYHVLELLQYTRIVYSKKSNDLNHLDTQSTTESFSDKTPPQLEKLKQSGESTVKASSDFPNTFFSWLPDGFSNIGNKNSSFFLGHNKTQVSVYSDGLASFSVFIALDHNSILRQYAFNDGALSITSKIMKYNNNYYDVTVVGNIPLGTAERVAMSVNFKI